MDDEKKDTHHTHDAVVAPASTAYDRDRDYADPEVRFESESTHRGEFGTKRDLVSVWVATPRRVASIRCEYDRTSCIRCEYSNRTSCTVRVL